METVQMGKNRLCLGTVQMGQQYGIKNELGRKPEWNESFSVLQAAISAGIDCFDTASAYGDAEELLGCFGLCQYPVKIISKLRADLDFSKTDVLYELKGSLDRLRVGSIYGYMLHRGADCYCPEILQGLLQAKEAGLTNYIGVSIYDPEEALYAVKNPAIDMIQIPYNVLDQRLDETDFFELADKNNVQVYARSAFLQGLLLMEPDQLPPRLQSAQGYLRNFHEIAKQHHFSALEASMLYSYCHPGITYVVFGVDTVEQLTLNLDAAKKADDFKECYEDLHGAFRNIERDIIVPSMWGTV